MEYRKFGSDFVVRLDPGDEVVTSLTKLCEKEDIRLGSVSGLGAIHEATIGIFDTEKKQYHSRDYAGMYEIASLVGNLTRMEGKPYLHLHITIGNVVTGECHCGHLSRAVISATGEIIVHVIEGEVTRNLGPVGLNLFQF